VMQIIITEMLIHAITYDFDLPIVVF